MLGRYHTLLGCMLPHTTCRNTCWGVLNTAVWTVGSTVVALLDFATGLVKHKRRSTKRKMPLKETMDMTGAFSQTEWL
jgi:hypothetical protein